MSGKGGEQGFATQILIDHPNVSPKRTQEYQFWILYYFNFFRLRYYKDLNNKLLCFMHSTHFFLFNFFINQLIYIKFFIKKAL